MQIKKDNIKSINLFVGFFLAFSGYYAALIVLTNLATGLESRNLTIPLRLIIVTTIGLIFLLKPRIRLQKGLVFFLIFAAAYLTRILVEYADPESTFHITELEFFLYFTSFVLLPLFFISQFRLSAHDYDRIFIAVMSGTLILSMLTFYFYHEIIGSVTRISQVIKRGENYISPGALSYSSALGIGVGIAYLITNKAGRLKKIFIYTTIGASFIPFYLGASRGSIFALGFPFVFYFLFANNVKKRATILLSIGLLSILFMTLTKYLGDGVFTRFSNISQDITSGSSSAVRIEIWYASLEQFWDNPLFGNSLNCDYFNHYPHNILLEVLITTGIIGFVPFVCALYIVSTKMKLIIKEYNEYSWITFIFIQALIQHMFSGGIYAAGWLSIGFGLILAINLNKKMNYQWTISRKTPVST